MNSKKVSVIVVAHEAYVEYLAECIHSIESQHYGNELIIVNNGGSVVVDEMIEYASTHRDAVIIRTDPQSLAAASNRGINASTGEYFMRVDADDSITPMTVGLLVRVAASYNCDAVHCDYFGGDSVRHHEKLEHACGVLIRRETFEALGGYDESLQYQEAFDLWCRFRRDGYVSKHLPLPLYFYRTGHESMSTNIEEREKVRKMLEEKYGVTK